MTIVEMDLMSHCIATRSVTVMRWLATMGSAFLLCGNVMELITVETILMRQIVVSTELLETVIVNVLKLMVLSARARSDSLPFYRSQHTLCLYWMAGLTRLK
jgi:hypothetical protein